MKKKNQGTLRFPIAKIKKIIQCNEEIGKIQHSIPFIVGRSLEIFLKKLLEEAQQVATERNNNKLTIQCLKQTIETHPKYDFLKFLTTEIIDFKDKKPSKKTLPKNGKQLIQKNIKDSKHIDEAEEIIFQDLVNKKTKNE